MRSQKEVLKGLNFDTCLFCGYKFEKPIKAGIKENCPNCKNLFWFEITETRVQLNYSAGRWNLTQNYEVYTKDNGDFAIKEV